jgi:lysophospholipase L1-like esterase
MKYSFLKKVKLYFISYSILLLLLFFIGEVVVRAFYPQVKNYNMEMWRYSKDIKQPLNDTILPFHHHPNKSGDYYGVNISTNSLGFRNKEIDSKKTKKRILFIGDSFTLGWGVDSDSTYSNVLENKLTENGYEYDVINSGIGNYNTQMELELFKRKGIKVAPDVVVLMYFINDAEPTPKISKSHYNLFKSSYLIAYLADRISMMRINMDTERKWKNYYNNLYDQDSKALHANIKSLEEIANICNQKGIPMLVVNIPELHELKEYPFNHVTKKVKRIAERNNCLFLDLLPSIKDIEPKSLWVSSEDSHANNKANNIFANQIFMKLTESDYIK